ncbi:ABC transporter [Nitzschia inconspicua]|uniref:ABC transporter n=1 Tax=Nitzschia inconspicua TaxID=303405 RepID=A0A9K3M5M6_9STRA|nr:ABC transporter [Nitzschia inconspicua]KAG7373620.1 ABC transporter [Nitzschia inconspicua]
MITDSQRQSPSQQQPQQQQQQQREETIDTIRCILQRRRPDQSDHDDDMEEEGLLDDDAVEYLVSYLESAIGTTNNGDHDGDDDDDNLDDDTILSIYLESAIGTTNNGDHDGDDDDDNLDDDTILSMLRQFLQTESVCQEILSILRQANQTTKKDAIDSTHSTSTVAAAAAAKTTAATTTTAVSPIPFTTIQDDDSAPTTTPSISKYTVATTTASTSTTERGGDINTSPKTSKKSHKQERLERRRNKKLQQRQIKTNQSDSAGNNNNNDDDDDDVQLQPKTHDINDDLLELNDHSSAWKQVQAEQSQWGGRGKGGRGVRYYGDNHANLYLPSVSLQFQGKTLLQDSVMTIDKGHRYGLLGRNGVGKSTLFRALHRHLIPGLPHNYSVLLVNQQLLDDDDDRDLTTLQAVLEADTNRSNILQQQTKVENLLEQGVDVLENAAKLEQLLLDWEAIDGDTAEQRAKDILKGLGFTKQMIQQPTHTLSGGWKMRLSLARALFVQHTVDLLLLDEISNHLDLHGILWLQQYLTSDKCQDLTIMVISHDRDFLGAVTTDIIVMNHQRLTYHPGDYWEYQRQVQERTSMQSNKLEAAEKQRQRALEFVQKQQAQSNKKSADPNKQRQAKMIKDKKLDRIGMFREDGKRFQNFSLAKMDMKSARMGQHVEIEQDERVLTLRFPNPTWPPSLTDAKSPVITLEDLSFQYSSHPNELLQHLTLTVDRGSKIALVGRNGCGKSTLIKLLTGELGTSSSTKDYDGKITSGRIWRHPNIRIGHVSQYSVEELEKYGHLTVVEYAEQFLKEGRASSQAIERASNKGYGSNVRQYLGAFGLGGEHAHRLIRTLSGGERMRLCFCTEMADAPHVLVLDESSNHLDLETLDSLAAALQAFEGAVVMVSHNQGFLRIFANTLWICDRGTVQALYSDNPEDGSVVTDSTFDDLFGQYRSQVMSDGAAATRSNARRIQADMAKRAGKQSQGTSSRTALLA